MALVGDDAAVLVPAAQVRLRNGDTAYPFRQNSDFLYLTGFEEPEALLLLAPGRSAAEQILFCRDHDARAERYDGARLGPEAAAETLGLDDAFPVGDLDEILPGILEGRRRVYFAVGSDADFDRRVLAWVNGIRTLLGASALPPCEFVDIGHLLHDMRLVKSPAELRQMREAARISSAAHVRAMQHCVPGANERDLEAELLWTFRRGGATGPAYECIVAAGDNACTMHYVRNDAPLGDAGLVLIDAGCEFRGYAADITRTFPVNGRFEGACAELYDLVLEAQLAAIDAVRPGAHFNAPHEAAMRLLTAGLVDLGLLRGALDELLESDAARPYCVHKSSHWLGLDVHDVGDYRIGEAWRELEAGMVLTVEPGLYFPADLEGVPDAFRGIGIRIEDDVAVTRDGHEVLTAEAPKTRDAIEALMAGAAT
jgi:Xaa-Pro aminopeptidase